MAKSLSLHEQRDIVSRLNYEVLASEIGKRRAARRKNPGRNPVLYICVCGWIGGARDSRLHHCAGKQLQKYS